MCHLLFQPEIKQLFLWAELPFLRQMSANVEKLFAHCRPQE